MRAIRTSDSDQRAGRRRAKPSVDSPYSYRFGEGQPASGRPSIGRRMFRTLVRFSIAVLIGVGATLGWQSYGDEAKEMLVAQAPALGLLLPVLDDEVAGHGCLRTDPTRQLAPLASTLDAVRRSVEQLAASKNRWPRTLRHCGLPMRTSDRRCHPRRAAGPGPAGRLDPAAQTAATQDRLSPAASRRTTVLALTDRIAGDEIDQRPVFKPGQLLLLCDRFSPPTLDACHDCCWKHVEAYRPVLKISVECPACTDAVRSERSGVHDPVL